MAKRKAEAPKSKPRSPRSTIALFRRNVYNLAQLVEQYEQGTTHDHLVAALNASEQLLESAECDLNAADFPKEGRPFGEMWLDIGGEVQGYLNTSQYTVEEVAYWFSITPEQASKMHAEMY